MVFLIVTYGCAIFCISMGIFSIQKKTPMHFYAGTTVKANEISDIKEFNRANGIMWIAYGSMFIISAILAVLVSGTVGGTLMVICSTFGLVILDFAYGGIYRKYKI